MHFNIIFQYIYGSTDNVRVVADEKLSNDVSSNVMLVIIIDIIYIL